MSQRAFCSVWMEQSSTDLKPDLIHAKSHFKGTVGNVKIKQVIYKDFSVCTILVAFTDFFYFFFYLYNRSELLDGPTSN